MNNHEKCKEFNIFNIRFKVDCYTVFAVFNEFCMFLKKIIKLLLVSVYYHSLSAFNQIWILELVKLTCSLSIIQMHWYLNHYFNLHVCVHISVLSHFSFYQINSSRSQNVTDRSFCTCFRNNKYVLLTPGVPRILVAVLRGSISNDPQILWILDHGKMQI